MLKHAIADRSSRDDSVPVSIDERIDVVDVLRGFALFGILLINITAFKAPGGPPGLNYHGSLQDRLTLDALILLVESKFFTLFSFLFGLGFSIQLFRAEQKGTAFAPRFLRRLLGLLVFGVAHIVFLWEGDILFLYALVGLLLLAFRNAAPRRLLSWAVGLLLTALTLNLLAFGTLVVLRMSPSMAERLRQADAQLLLTFARGRADAIRVYGSGAYRDIVAQNIRSYGETFPLLVTRIPIVLAMFLLGLYAGKRGIIQQPGAQQALLRRIRLYGLGLGLPMSAMIVIGYTSLPPVSALGVLFFDQTLTGPLLALGYAATLILLMQRRVWATRLHPLAAPGRMALTNYLMQSVICTMLFYGYGLGRIGQVRPFVGILLACGIYAAQIGASGWWLRRFALGPMEWLWRSFIYLRWQPLRKPTSN